MSPTRKAAVRNGSRRTGTTPKYVLPPAARRAAKAPAATPTTADPALLLDLADALQPGVTWARWKSVLRHIVGLPLSDADCATLTEAIGRAVTDLKPGGSAEFPFADDRRVTQVVSDSGFVNAGTKLAVREVHGNRVVVRPIA